MNEKKKQEILYGKEELKNKTIQELEDELKASLPSDTKSIINRYVNVREQDTCLDVEVVYEVLEKIGTKEKLV